MLLIHALPVRAQQPPVAWWSFDDVSGHTAGLEHDRLSGNFRVVDGVSGSALVLDGYTTVLRRSAVQMPQLGAAFTIEAWIAPAAYPWNRVPIVNQADDTLRGFSFEIGPRGELGLMVVVDGRELVVESDDLVVPLRRWSHVAARFDGRRGLSLHVNGTTVALRPLPDRLEAYGRVPDRNLRQADELDLLIGAVREARRPAAYHRHKGTLPSWFSFDGLLDELKIYDVARSDRDIAKAAVAFDPGAPPLPARRFPSGPEGPGRFGAYQTTLSYYPEWDALWRVGPHADLLIRFDRSAARVVFWRGTQYSPAWVTGNGLWMADQSVEGYDDDYTWEHMNDKQNRYSHVRLIEQNDARVVVHWRYAPVSVENELLNVSERLGNGAWIDEYYYFYPDVVGVRKVTWRRGTLGAPIQFQESIPLAHPGQTQGEVVNADYVTVGNLDGETRVFSYVENPVADSKPVPANLTVQMHNLKSREKPFIVFEPGNAMTYLRDLDIGSLSKPGSSSHWPVGQIPSDGRTSQALDRASSFLGFPISEPPLHRGDDGRDFVRSLYGMSDRSFDELLDLARSWSRPPELKINGAGYESIDYDRSERAYRLRRLPGTNAALSFSIEASAASPIHNLALVIDDWGEGGASLSVDGHARQPGAEFRSGHRYRLGHTDLIVWIGLRAESTVEIQLQSQNNKTNGSNL